MLWGLDAAYAPGSLGLARLQFDLGYRFYGGYVGGRALNVWKPEEWRRVSDAGFSLLPIWVAPLVADGGRQLGVDEGNACLAELEKLGLSGQVVIDVESGRRPLNYLGGFHDALAAGSCEVTLYGSATTIEAAEGLSEHWWLAYWPTAAAGLQSGPPDFEVWQYGGASRLDLDVAVDGFPFAQLAATQGA